MEALSGVFLMNGTEKAEKFAHVHPSNSNMSYEIYDHPNTNNVKCQVNAQ